MNLDDPSTLVLSEAQQTLIEREAVAAYPNECCGIIIGMQRDRERRVSALRAVDNSFESRERYHRFSISPQHLIEAEKRAGERNELVLGFYHSHPDHPANPSEFDRQHAWPFYSYVIVSVNKSVAGEMKCWKLNDKTEQLEPQQLRAIADATERKES